MSLVNKVMLCLKGFTVYLGCVIVVIQGEIVEY